MLKPIAHTVSIATRDELFDLKHALQMVESGKINGIAFESEGKKMEDFNGNVLVNPLLLVHERDFSGRYANLD